MVKGENGRPCGAITVRTFTLFSVGILCHVLRAEFGQLDDVLDVVEDVTVLSFYLRSVVWVQVLLIEELVFMVIEVFRGEVVLSVLYRQILNRTVKL